MLRMIASVFLIGHIVCCMWHYIMISVGSVGLHLENTFATSAYLYCLRDGIFLVVAQDREAFEDAEFVFLLIMGPFAFFFFAYIFGKTSVLVQRSLAVQTKHHESMSFIRSAMNSLALPKDLRLRIESYHHYMHVHHNPVAYQSLFDGLSEYLLIELKLFLFRQLFVSSDLFQDSDPKLIQQLVTALTECTFCPGDVIILRGAMGREMFFIVKGKCEVLNDNNVPVVILRNGQYFGEIALLMEQRRSATIRAASFCILGKLTKQSFVSIVAEFPAEQAKMEKVAQKRMAVLQKSQNVKSTAPTSVKVGGRKVSILNKAMAKMTFDRESKGGTLHFNFNLNCVKMKPNRITQSFHFCIPIQQAN